MNQSTYMRQVQLFLHLIVAVLIPSQEENLPRICSLFLALMLAVVISSKQMVHIVLLFTSKDHYFLSMLILRVNCFYSHFPFPLQIDAQFLSILTCKEVNLMPSEQIQVIKLVFCTVKPNWHVEFSYRSSGCERVIQ